MNTKIMSAIMAAIVLFAGFFYCRDKSYKEGYKEGYNVAYGKGYTDGYTDKAKIPEVKTETKIVYQKIPYTGADVQVTTPPPTVTVAVNGKKQDIKQKQETADLQVKTETNVDIKIPERRWTFGIGADGHKSVYMLKVPIKGAVGIWAAGTKGKAMGGVSISF